jgi:hypothetical protein
VGQGEVVPEEKGRIRPGYLLVLAPSGRLHGSGEGAVMNQIKGRNQPALWLSAFVLGRQRKIAYDLCEEDKPARA